MITKDPGGKTDFLIFHFECLLSELSIWSLKYPWDRFLLYYFNDLLNKNVFYIQVLLQSV